MHYRIISRAGRIGLRSTVRQEIMGTIPSIIMSYLESTGQIYPCLLVLMGPYYRTVAQLERRGWQRGEQGLVGLGYWHEYCIRKVQIPRRSSSRWSGGRKPAWNSESDLTGTISPYQITGMQSEPKCARLSKIPSSWGGGAETPKYPFSESSPNKKGKNATSYRERQV